MINTEDFLERALENLERLTQMNQDILAQFKELGTNSFNERKEYTEAVDAFNLTRATEEAGWVFVHKSDFKSSTSD